MSKSYFDEQSCIYIIDMILFDVCTQNYYCNHIFNVFSHNEHMVFIHMYL